MNLVSKLDKIDAELRQEIKLEAKQHDSSHKKAVLMRARCNLQACITDLLELSLPEGVENKP